MDSLLDRLNDNDSVLWQAANHTLGCHTSTPPSAEAAAVDDSAFSSARIRASSCSPSQTGQTGVVAQAVTKACLTCREKHLKCNGLRPCSRCVASNTECVFVASRRGYHSSQRNAVQKRRRQQQRQEQEHHHHHHQRQQQSQSTVPLIDRNTADSLVLRTHETSVARTRSPSRPPPPQPDLPSCLSVPAGVRFIDDSDTLLTSYYSYAFAAHPFVLPRNYLCKVEDVAMDAVVAAMRWVGSMYLGSYATSRVDLYNEAQKLVYDPQTPRNGFLAQAMMLLVVGLDGCCEQHKAARTLDDVEQLALQIQLHTRDFATLQGRGMPVLEESWRRTWWDLYIIDGMIAGVRRQSSFALYDVAADVQLPCEEDEYLSGVIPPPLPLQALEDRGFLEHGPALSSFSYRILSGRNLGAMLRIPATCSPADAAVQKVETLLTSWRLHVPPSKQDALRKDGTPDEMMFQACIMMHATSILLHQPFSRLATRPLQGINACGPPWKPTAQTDAVQDVHTAKMNESACAISAMVTCGVSLLSHTHFFTCVLTLSSIVHLSRWALLSSTFGGDDDFLREQVRLNMGALERRAAVWSAARRACTQVTCVARDIYQSRKEQQEMHSSIWDSISDTDFFIGDNEAFIFQ